MADLILERNEKIYKDWIGGKSQYKIAKEYGLTAQRIHQICKQEKRRIKNEDPLLNYLYLKYPDVSKRIINRGVNAIRKKQMVYNYFNVAKDHMSNSTDDFFFFVNLYKDELMYINAIGVKTYAFLIKALYDWNATKEVSV